MKENNANAYRRQRHEALKQLQRRNDLWQKLNKVPCSPPNILPSRTHSQSKNKLSETFCSSNPPQPQSLLSPRTTIEKKSRSIPLCRCQGERVLHEYPPSHEEPKSAKIKDEEFNNLLGLSEVPLCYQPSSDCGYPRGIESNATALFAAPEVKMTTIIANGREKQPCAEEEDEDISVDLSNCHSAKLETVLKKGQRRRVIEA